MRQLIYGSVVLKETSVAFEQWYYDLIPFIHYIPFENAWHLDRLLTLCIDNNNSMAVNETLQSIAFSGMYYILDNLSIDRFVDESIGLLSLYCRYYPSMCVSSISSNRRKDKLAKLDWNTMDNLTSLKEMKKLKKDCQFMDSFDNHTKAFIVDQMLAKVFEKDMISELKLEYSRMLLTNRSMTLNVVAKRINMLYSLLPENERVWTNEMVAHPSVNAYWNYREYLNTEFDAENYKVNEREKVITTSELADWTTEGSGVYSAIWFTLYCVTLWIIAWLICRKTSIVSKFRF